MSSSTEHDTPGGTGSDGGNEDSRSGGSATGSIPPEPLLAPAEPLTAEEWNLLRAPFSEQAYVVQSRAVGRTGAYFAGEDGPTQRSVVDLWLKAEALRDRLDWVIGPGRYAYRAAPAPRDEGRHSIFCHLQIGAAVRTGIAAGSRLQAAREIALADAAVNFGIGVSGDVSGPVAAEKDRRHLIPQEVLEALETRSEPSFWAPGGEPPDNADPVL